MGNPTLWENLPVVMVSTRTKVFLSVVIPFSGTSGTSKNEPAVLWTLPKNRCRYVYNYIIPGTTILDDGISTLFLGCKTIGAMVVLVVTIGGLNGSIL